MIGERCPHCGGWVAPARRSGDQIRAMEVHTSTCPAVLRVVKR